MGRRPAVMGTLNHQGIGPLVLALDALLHTHPDHGAVIKLGGEIWLDDPSDD